MNPEVIKAALPEVVTQLLGFLIVFWVLKKYAFKSVLDVVDARKKKIEDLFADIEGRKKNAENLEKEYRVRLDQIEQEARTKIQEAAAVGMQLSRDIHERARMEAQKTADRAKAEIENDLAKAKITLRDQIVDLSSLISERVISEKLDAADQKRLVEQFVKEMETIGR